jgi:hypothetical protein
MKMQVSNISLVVSTTTLFCLLISFSKRLGTYI